MNATVYQRSDDGCGGSWQTCVDGRVHLESYSSYCHHTNDYSESHRVVGPCDGSCRGTEELPYVAEWLADAFLRTKRASAAQVSVPENYSPEMVDNVRGWSTNLTLDL